MPLSQTLEPVGGSPSCARWPGVPAGAARRPMR